MVPLLCGAVALAAACLGLLWSFGILGGGEYGALFREKAELLKPQALSEDIRWELETTPAGEAGFAVFFSVCDGESRARVYTGTGETLDAAWESAFEAAWSGVGKNRLRPEWVKADVAYLSREISMEELGQSVQSGRAQFFRYGVAFDPAFETALLEAELNGAKIFDYENGGIDLEYLNHYLEKAGRKQLEELPETCTAFRCFGWLCDGDNTVLPLSAGSLDYGYRQVDTVDDACVEEMIRNAADYLMDQVREDGSFVYGRYPRFDNEIDDYNILRHAGTVWALLCRYRMEPSQELADAIDRTAGYLLESVVAKDADTSYLYEEKSGEIKLGGCGLAVIALTEYMDVFQSDAYLEVCRQLGNGILSMLDQDTGEYVHVLNRDFSLKETFRTVYYDGEATFALSRLYALTGDQVWLDAACAAVDHFIAADYTQHKDHWIAYAMNEVTKFVTDRPDYYAFALQNAQRNLETIYRREITSPTDLELLMATFELYLRIDARGAAVEGFELEPFLGTIYHRADQMRSSYFYPEMVMYMENPQRVLHTFMVRQDGFRVRIDDVQHNIGGYYLYWKNYEKLVEYGMLEYRVP